MLLFHGSANGIGVDFGTSAIKLVEIRRRRRGVSLVTYAYAPQPNLLVESAVPDAVARMATLLRAMMRRAGVGGGQITAALPILSVYSTVLDLPDMPARDLDGAVAFSARNYVPSPLKDVVLGWTKIGVATEMQSPRPTAAALSATPRSTLSALSLEDGGSAAGMLDGIPSVSSLRRPEVRKVQEIFVTAAPRESVNRYTQVFERLELKLAALEVESFPLARSLLRGETRPVLLVDFGDQTTSFSIVDEGYLRINQAIDVGGESLTEAIARRLSVSREEAERRKRAEGVGTGDVASPLTAAMRPVLSDAVGRGETVRRLYERKRGRPLGKVVIIGGGSLLPGLPALWTSMTGLPAEVGNPWRGIEVPSALSDRLRTLGPSFAVAVGLALRTFDAEK